VDRRTWWPPISKRPDPRRRRSVSSKSVDALSSDPDAQIRTEVTVVVVSFQDGDDLRRCVESLVDRADVTTLVLVVDNDPEGGLVGDVVRDYPMVRRLVSSGNIGFSAAANVGLAESSGDWFALINPDTVVPPQALKTLLDELRSSPASAAVAPRLCQPDGTNQPFSYGSEPAPFYIARRAIARVFGRSLHDWGAGKTRAVDWISGACLVARRKALDQVGPLDERFFLYFEDVDWCRRCRQAGWTVLYAPDVFVTHRSNLGDGDVRRRAYYQASLVAYYRKYYGSVWALVIWLATRLKLFE
jgi:N-acetylglucosaminyl-diphospho-decaprenol L-rhamnosyltransferase